MTDRHGKSTSMMEPMTAATKQTESTVKRRRHTPKEIAQNIESLALPWAGLILASVAAAFVLYSRTNDDDISQDNILERFLGGASTTDMHREHVHKHVFEESHKPLWPLDTSDQVGFTLCILGLMVAAGGGIGGGGILVPIYILVMGFSPKHAIPLSNITVLGGALGNMILNVRKRHPLADRPLGRW